MYPGLSDADRQVAEFRYRHLVAEGQRQQFAASARPATRTGRQSPAIRHQIGTLLVRAGQSLQGAQAMAKETIGAIA
jgi:hypothetical protein